MQGHACSQLPLQAIPPQGQHRGDVPALPMHATSFEPCFHDQLIGRAKTTIQFVLRFPVAGSFPTGYTDLRFTVFVHHKAQRTIIYGTPKHLIPGGVLRVAVLVPVSNTWIGQAMVVGTVTLLSKPNGVSLHHVGRGTAILTVVR
jgi:hypothetical protein